MNHEFFEWLFRFPSIDSLEKITKIKDKYLPITDNITYIHITGTNGKGSVARYLHQTIMSTTNLKVALFTSPHIAVINERIMINQQMISDDDLLRIKNLIAVDVQQLQLGFFAILTLIALIYFHEQKVDYAIIEVGIGGLLDATNIIKSDYVVLTSIGNDHQEALGKTQLSIIKQKIGIVKPTTKAVFINGNIAKKLKDYLQNTIVNPLFLTEKLKTNSFFIKNQNTAKIVLSHLFPELSEQKMLECFANTTNLLRFQPVKVREKQIYFDVAHNINAIKALIKLIKSQKIQFDLIIFSALKTKSPNQLINLLKPMANEMIICHNKHVNSIIGESFAIKSMILNHKAQIILITGSCYFAAEVYCELMNWQQRKVNC